MQTGVVLLATLVLLAVQLGGLHFHVQQLGAASDSDVSAPVVAYAVHLDAHAVCHEDSCGMDLPAADFWKSSDQGWNAFALLAIAIFLLLPIIGRRVRRITPAGNIPFERPVFLRPPSRAPPR